jgi:antitoxin StbD
MNAPFKSDPVEPILAEICVGISGLKRNPAAVIAAARVRQVAILNRNKPVAYVISPEVWEHICDVFEDLRDSELVRERLAEDDEEIEVTLEELSAGIPEESRARVEKAGRDDPRPIRKKAG